MAMDQPFNQEIFLPARASLLHYHDERELVIRWCRDINAYSKKLIFSCHRINASTDVHDQLQQHLEILADRLVKINEISDSIHFPTYKSTISNCIEELIEGFTFYYYILYQQILPYNKFLSIIDQMISQQKVSVVDLFKINDVCRDYHCKFIFEGDYFMGLFDLTGEIMRYSITNLIDSNTNQLNPDVTLNLSFLQSFHSFLLDLFINYPNLNVNRGQFSIDYDSKNCANIKKKIETFNQSLNKVQSMVLDICIRGNEFNLHQIQDNI